MSPPDRMSSTTGSLMIVINDDLAYIETQNGGFEEPLLKHGEYVIVLAPPLSSGSLLKVITSNGIACWIRKSSLQEMP